MANPTDLQGMLTSQLLQPQAQAAIPSTYEQRMLQHGADAARTMRRGMGALTGSDTRSTAEKAQAMMANLDINDPKDQPKILQLVNSINPAQAPKLVAAFAQQKRQRDASGAKTQVSLKNRKSVADQIKEKYPNLAEAVMNEEGTGRTDALKEALSLIKELGKEAEDKRTDDMKEYQYAVSQGSDLTFAEYMGKNKRSNIDLMDVDTGITNKVLINRDGEILKTIGVSKLPELKRIDLPNGKYSWENTVTGKRGIAHDTPESAEQERKRVSKLYSNLSQIDSTLGTIMEAKTLVTEKGAAGLTYNYASLPIGTSERELQGKVSTLQSTLAFDRLQKMRDDSKTGGALGQVSNIELQLLKENLTALDPILGDEAFIAQLNKVEKHYNNFRKSLLGETPEINWSDPIYKGKTTVVDGVRYMVDPIDPNKVYNIGTE